MSRKRHTVADEPHFLVRSLATEYAAGDTISRHTHRWGQLIFASCGVLHALTAEGAWIAPPHWAIWAPPGVVHSIRFAGKASLRTLYFRPGLGGLPCQSGVIPVTPLLRELIHRAVEIGMLDDRDPMHLAMLTLILQELKPVATPSLDLRMPTSPNLRRVAELLLKKPSQTEGNATLARRMDIGLRTLERGFRHETGVALGVWRRQARFLHALRLLGGGAAVKQAAVDAGYRSPSAFIAAFREVFQTTPGKYFRLG
jgi:AraC-like DNA-binding protein